MHVEFILLGLKRELTEALSRGGQLHLQVLLRNHLFITNSDFSHYQRSLSIPPPIYLQII